jgi:hypothetical protein
MPTNAIICAPKASETMTLSIDADIPGSTYLWTGNGITAANSTLKNPVVALTDMQLGVNNYSCTLTLGAPCSTISSVGTVTVTIVENPSVTTTNPAEVCAPATVNLTLPAVTAGSSNNLIYTYFSDLAATIAVADPAAVASSGTYYIKGTNTETGCYDIKPVMVVVNPLPAATISYPNSPYCTRGTATVIQTGVAGGTYSSDAGLSISPVTGAIDLAASTPGSHIVTYSFSDGTCPNTTIASITVNATTMPAALADITAQCSVIPTAPTLSDPCAGDLTATTTTIFPITAQGTTVVTWTFHYGNGYTQTAIQNVIITNTTPDFVAIPAFCAGSAAPALATTSPNGITGTWSPAIVSNTSDGTYIFTPDAGQCAASQTLNVTVTVIPAPTGASPQDYTTGQTLQYLAVDGTGIIWYDAPAGGNVLPDTTPLVSGVVYYASQTASGCESPTRLAVEAGVNLKNDSFDLNTFKCYPNPVNDILTVSYSETVTGLKLYNMIGQLLIIKSVNSNETQFDMSSLPAGSYLLEVAVGNKSKMVKLFKNK